MNKPLSVAANALRQRLIEDMNLRGFTAKTRRYHIRHRLALCGIPVPLTGHSHR
jgi:hypothetical protein